MTDHMHGLCQNCISKCTETIQTSKKQNVCMRCQQQEPEIIVDEQGLISAICSKCYLKEQQPSPTKKNEFKQEWFKRSGSMYRTISKSQYSNKSFFNNEYKMVRKVQKFFLRFENNVEDMLKQLHKKALFASPLTWDKVASKCDKVGQLMFIFISKQHVMGAYHSEPIKIGDKLEIEDSESGFFFSNRNKVELQFFKLNSQVVTYNVASKTISFGKQACFDIWMQGSEAKVRSDIVPFGTEWTSQFVYKL